MKYIFDFDDVIFNNTAQFKVHMYSCLENVGIPKEKAEEYYKEVRMDGFSVKKLVSTIFIKENITIITEEELCEAILSKCRDFLNTELIEIIKNLGRENFFIVTHGIEEYQLEKIKRTEITSLFSRIVVVQDSKKEAIEAICNDYKDEKVLFIDDQIKRLIDLDMEKAPNLKTVLFDEHGLEKLKQEIENNS
jgi:FMN phosphatase YigB (HAD superfamily)